VFTDQSQYLVYFGISGDIAGVETMANVSSLILLFDVFTTIGFDSCVTYKTGEYSATSLTVEKMFAGCKCEKPVRSDQPICFSINV